MFPDPQSLTINAVGRTLQKINQDRYSSEYLLRTSTGESRLFIRNTSRLDKRRGVHIDRHNVEFVETVFAVAPATVNQVRRVYYVIENQQGDTLTDPVNIAAGLFAWSTASTNANLTKLMNSES